MLRLIHLEPATNIPAFQDWNVGGCSGCLQCGAFPFGFRFGLLGNKRNKGYKLKKPIRLDRLLNF
jgi:hypothetical protein